MPDRELELSPRSSSLSLSWGATTGKLPKQSFPYRVARMLATIKLMGFDVGPCERDHLCDGMHVRIDNKIFVVASVSSDSSQATLLECGPTP